MPPPQLGRTVDYRPHPTYRPGTQIPKCQQKHSTSMTTYLPCRQVPRWRIIKLCPILLIAVISCHFFFLRGNLLRNSKRQQEQSTDLNRIHNIYHDVMQPHTNGNFQIVGNIFYVWCYKNGRSFEFRHYLGIVSAIRHLNVDNVYFYYDQEPQVDQMHYNTWLTEISDQYPFLHKVKMSDSSKGCTNDGLLAVPTRAFITSIIEENGGGIYIREDVIILKSAIELRTVDYINLVDERNQTVLLSMKNKEPFANCSKRSLEVKLSIVELISTTEKLPVMSGHMTFIGEMSPVWVKSKSLPYLMIAGHLIYPKDIWELESETGNLLRTLAYGKPEVARSVPSYDVLVPNIAHFIWNGGGEMDFLFFLSVLSMLHVALVDTVYIHGDKPPHGFYWDLIKHHQHLEVVHRYINPTIFGTDTGGFPNEKYRLSLVSDIWRVDIMLRYGGIYMDTDAVFLRPLDREIRGYDAVAANDIPGSKSENAPFPDICNFGVTIGKRNAEFWRLFQLGMKRFLKTDWFWNGLRLPYKIKERHPTLLHIDPHLQVLCFKGSCYPTWLEGYGTGATKPNDVNWKTDTNAYHWTSPTPHEFTSAYNLLEGSGTWSDIGRYILSRSGMLEYFQNLTQFDKNH